MIVINSLRSLIASQILGDGAVKYPSLEIAHSEKQRDYVVWKLELFQRNGCRTSELRNYVRNSTFGYQSVWLFKVYGVLKNFVIKDANELVHELDSLGLLLWWLDDGCLSIHEKKNGISVSRFGYLNTQNLRYDENVKVSEALLHRFGISTKIHIDRGGVGIFGRENMYYRLYLNATAMRTLIDIVRPHLNFVPPSLLYKFHMDYRPTSLETSQLYMNMYNFL